MSIQKDIEKWNVRFIPIGISFEHYFKGNDSLISPFFGLGPLLAINSFKSQGSFEGLYFNPVGSMIGIPIEILIKDGTNNIPGSFIRFRGGSNKSNTEIHYGGQAYFGIRFNRFKQFFIESSLRFRYAQGLQKFDNQDAEKNSIDLTGVDFTFGIGVRL